jgi:thioredoxin 1
MSHAALKVGSADFQSVVLNSKVPVFVDFWATWCPPCKRIAPFVEELAKDFDGRAKVVKIDVDDAGDIAQSYGIMSIPTLMVFKGGKPVEQFVGAMPKEQMASMLERHL